MLDARLEDPADAVHRATGTLPMAVVAGLLAAALQYVAIAFFVLRAR